MRQIVLDTETTGLDPKQGHRIIEIAAVEFVNRRPTGRNIHFYLNPERDIDSGATDVHGFTWDMLRDKAKFAEVADEFLEFARGAQLIIHNAPFDVAFLDEELKRVDLPSVAAVAADVIDTLAMARDHFPGKKNNLDALCERFGVSNAHRTLHGAMLDAQLLAEVYLSMTRGQDSLTIDIAIPVAMADGTLAMETLAAVRVLMPSQDELDLHRAYLAELQRESRGACLWVSLPS
jgi:DNA polymerase-3 subunit epsilon